MRETGCGTLPFDRVADRAIERIRVGGRLDQEVLGSVADRSQGDRFLVGVREHHHGHVRGARQNCVERVGRVVVARRKVEHDAVDRALAECDVDGRHRVPNEHVGLSADPLPQPIAERRGLVRGCVYYEQP